MSIWMIAGLFFGGVFTHMFLSRLLRTYQMVAVIRDSNLSIIMLTKMACQTAADIVNETYEKDQETPEEDKAERLAHDLAGLEAIKMVIVESIFMTYPSFLHKTFGFERNAVSAFEWADEEVKTRMEKIAKGVK